jgi:hypothetical protein
MSRSRRRRSTMSASAPAGRARRKNGRLVAVCISATMMGDGANAVINHTAPTSCIQVPMFDAAAAIHNERKTGWRSGLHAEAVALLSVDPSPRVCAVVCDLGDVAMVRAFVSCPLLRHC